MNSFVPNLGTNDTLKKRSLTIIQSTRNLYKIFETVIFITDKPKVPSTFTPMALLEAAISR